MRLILPMNTGPETRQPMLEEAKSGEPLLVSCVGSGAKQRQTGAVNAIVGNDKRHTPTCPHAHTPTRAHTSLVWSVRTHPRTVVMMGPRLSGTTMAKDHHHSTAMSCV